MNKEKQEQVEAWIRPYLEYAFDQGYKQALTTLEEGLQHWMNEFPEWTKEEALYQEFQSIQNSIKNKQK